MTLHELRQKRKTLADEMRKLHSDIGEDTWSEEQRGKWSTMKKDLDGLEDQIKREEELRDLDQRFVDNHEDDHEERRNGGQEETAEKRQAKAFEAFIREGLGEMDPELRSVIREMRAQGTDPDSKGGFTVPVEFQSRVIERMKAYGGLANIANVITTSDGRSMEWATTDGTAEEGELLGENTAAGEGDVNFGMESLGAKKLSSKVIRLSNELLQDSGVSIESLLVNRLAMRLGRGEAKYLVNGSGAGTPVQPKGLATSVTGFTTTAGATMVWQDFNALKHSVDPAYRNSTCRWLFNDSTLQEASELVDTNGRPLWVPGLSSDAPATFLGHAYQVDQAVAEAAANAQFAYFGDFNAFIVRRVAGMFIKRLVERYAEYDQTGFIGFHRFDCLLEDAEAIKGLKLKA
ncbi:phage major capsid protein [Sansalvadorimonas verongulae]|uniref:phage major capsid protein n=1 Tax=Sansalvadorimonas verongulae TaxID=2172824 RepID=UPI0012BB7DEE|nr:phage major capsid protein [Sansalvadorimonas verongulae]MTI12045.1 phage major capsid protein [Sansalvadorimonas verongulae]